MTEGVDHLSLLTDDAQIAAWSNEGLPTDRMSVENATVRNHFFFQEIVISNTN